MALGYFGLERSYWVIKELAKDEPPTRRAWDLLRHRYRLDLPSAETIVDRHGSWDAFLEHSGVPSTRPGEVDPADHVRELAAAMGRSPSRREYERGRPEGTPSANTIVDRHGSWPTFLESVGLDPSQRPPRARRWSDEEIRDACRALPKATWVALGRAENAPSAPTVLRRFGSPIAAAGTAAPRPQPVYDGNDRLSAVRECPAQHLRPSAYDRWSAGTGAPRSRTLIRHYGSWQQVLEEAERAPT